jgi:hypothetical protein
MNSDTEERQLGEYRLKELLHEGATTRIWLAEQVSVARKVLVDELKEEMLSQSSQFLADVRAKAAVEHPLIGSVYEAVAEPGRCFFAHEFLHGATLEDRIKAGEPFKPERLAHVLRRVAESQLHHEALGQATSPLEPRHVHIDEHGVIRISNLAVGGERAPDQSAQDIARMGRSLRALVADGQPGATRMLTLLGWMRGEGVDAPLSWNQIREVSTQIEQQLAEPPPPATGTKPGAARARKPPVALISLVAGAVLIAGFAIVISRRPEPKLPPPRPDLPNAVSIPAGHHATPDGMNAELPAFQIAPHEVTIGQYAEFLERLEILKANQQEKIFDHSGQPSEKTSHVPDDWENLLAAAKSGGTWNDKPVSLDSPVVGVDWWDAAAYAEWKHARLPSQEEWFAALKAGAADPAALKASSWAPLTTASPDRTANGLLGMAGSVCEWTNGQSANPANPLGEQKWVVIGGSYLKPGSNALTREWVDDRSLRRADLGFRVVFE